METKRISYIDAMRGFTMILVVYSHVCHFCLGDSTMGFNAVFFLFRLPCFFFISGWLFEPVSRRPFLPNVRHKFMVQIVPTFIFLLLLAPPPEFFHQVGALKGGYWFTFVLFEFFVINMLAVRCLPRYGWLLALVVSVGGFWFGGCQHAWRLSGEHGLLLDVAGLLSVSLWRYYLFFYVGTFVRRHFEAFIRLTSRPEVVAGVTLGFFAVALTTHPDRPWLEYLRFTGGGLLGVAMVFTAFRLSSGWMERWHVSRPLQYVGRRTLDVYLLHYFFLPRWLMDDAGRLLACNSQLLEFGVVMAVALVVLLLSLAASYVLRLSPFLARYLFGVKQA